MSLIHRAKIDPKAFTQLYEEHVQAVYQYFLIRLHTKSEAEDLTSIVWEAVLKNISHLNSNKEVVFRAWLFTIARNALNKYFKEKQNQKVVELDEEKNTFKSSERSPNELAEENEDAKQIQILIEALPSEQQETLTLRYFSDLKNKEIAKLLSVSQKTVASNLSRALKTLRDRWKNLQ
ncbi:MAG: RNA polymerase sigma factor [Candidatus Gracilibacteria bacterium]|jgi:RNA polymerase sigma-70 factor (ECF subfamily)